MTRLRRLGFILALGIVPGPTACIVATPAPATSPPPQGEVRVRDHAADPAGPPPPEVRDHGGEPPPPARDHRPTAIGPVSCQGNQDLAYEDCVIEGAEVAVRAQGNCSIVLSRCTIRASRVAISAQGNASVTIRGGTLDAPVAVDAQGNVEVVVTGAQVTGRVARQGNATVHVR